MLKSLNIKLPLTIAQKMDDSGQLNPQYINKFVYKHIMDEPSTDKIEGVTFTYTFKVPEALHKTVKLKAIEHSLPMNEFIGRLLVKYYT